MWCCVPRKNSKHLISVHESTVVGSYPNIWSTIPNFVHTTYLSHWHFSAECLKVKGVGNRKRFKDYSLFVLLFRVKGVTLRGGDHFYISLTWEHGKYRFRVIELKKNNNNNSQTVRDIQMYDCIFLILSVKFAYAIYWVPRNIICTTYGCKTGKTKAYTILPLLQGRVKFSATLLFVEIGF